MALSIKPGPIGLEERDLKTDSGPLPRSPSSPPGPILLGIVPPFPMQVKSAAPGKAGIRIHPASQISADDWLKKIKATADVPDYFKKQIEVKGNVIYVTNPKKFKFPNNVIAKDWLGDWLSVFIADEWEMTTGCLDIKVEKGDKAGPFITVVHNPDLSKGESVDGFTKHTMTAKGRSTQSINIEKGNTLPTGVTLNSGRKLIVVANRIALNLGGTIKRFNFEDSELLEVWFHETATHAGRNSVGKPDLHGDKEVESHARDIEDMFPKTTTVPKVLVEITTFVKK